MTSETQQIIVDLLKMSAVGTLISLPVGLWAMRRWTAEQDAWKAALVLTAFGFLTKDWLIRRFDSRRSSGD